MVNRYYKGTPYNGSLYSPPVDYIAKSLQVLQGRYDTNFQAAETQRNRFIDANPADRARANQLESEINSEVDNVVNKYNGDYSKATKDLYLLTKKIDKMYSPSGEAGAIIYNRNLVRESLKRERERLAKGEIDSGQLSLLENYYTNNVGPTTYNPETQTYSTVPQIDLPKTYDIHKEFEEILGKVKPKTIEQSYPTGRKTLDGYHEMATTKVTKIDPNEVSGAFAGKLRNDLQFQNYVQTMGRLAGVDPEELTLSVLNDYNTNVIPLRTGVIEDSSKLDYKEDWKEREAATFRRQLALENLRHNNAKKLATFKHELDNPTELTPARLTVGSPSRPTMPDIPLESYAPIAKGPMSNPIKTWFMELGFGRESVPTTYQGLMNDPNANVDKGRLASIKEANPNYSDRQIIEAYNYSKNKGQEYSTISYFPFETSSSQVEETTRLLPGLLNGSYRLYEMDANGNVSEIEKIDGKQEIAKKISDPSNPLKPKNTLAVGKAMSYTGHGIPSGATIIPSPYNDGKFYFAASPRTDVINANEDLVNKAVSFIKSDREIGDYVPLLDNNGKESGIIGKREWVNGSPQYVYYPAKNNGKEINFDDPVTFNGKLATPYDIERYIMKDETFKSLFPHKTKAQYEAEFINE